MYIVFCLFVCLQARREHHFSLQMVVILTLTNIIPQLVWLVLCSCSSNCCGLELCLYILLGLWELESPRENIQVHEVWWQSGSWRDRVQWVMRVEAEPGDSSLTSLQAGGKQSFFYK